MIAINRDQVDLILAEYDAVRSPSADAELEALRAAVFIEDVFGIRFSDAEIGLLRLSKASTMRELILTKLGIG